jgi:alkylhydroperoxidase/carboxymuconolactone decarboxylase family protein YurZ
MKEMFRSLSKSASSPEARSLEAEYNMSQSEDERKLPELQMDPIELEQLRSHYVELIGFVPPRIQARTDLLARVDPELLSMQEAIRAYAMYPECFDTKTAQLMLFGMLLVQLSDAAHLHARAAYRAGASWEELSAVVGLAFLFRGLSAANLGAQIIQEIAKNPG